MKNYYFQNLENYTSLSKKLLVEKEKMLKEIKKIFFHILSLTVYSF